MAKQNPGFITSVNALWGFDGIREALNSIIIRAGRRAAMADKRIILLAEDEPNKN